MHRVAVLALLLTGCQPLPPCLVDLEDAGSERTGFITLSDDAISAQLFVPAGLGRYPDGAPVVVYVHGSWATNFIPVDEGRSHFNPGLGIVQLYLNLPGGDEVPEYDSLGTDDRRGADARAAVAALLRYASDDEPDSDGCLLSERMASPLSGQLAMAGYSNGGHLAWTTLADPTLTVPEVVGVATYETPSASQFLLVESGTTSNESPVYIEGACGLEDGGILCDYDYEGIAFDPSGDGTLFIDTDSDGTHSPDEFRLSAVEYGGQWYHSPPARQAAEEAGLSLTDRPSVDDTLAFWLEREGPRAMAEAATRFPDIAGIATGAEIDHVLTGAVEHPHVTGMIAAMAEAGIAWHRLHPDTAYTTLASRTAADFPENPANTNLGLDTAPPMQPSGTTAHGEDYLTAATVELLDRAHDGEWGNDLESVLYR